MSSLRCRKRRELKLSFRTGLMEMPILNYLKGIKIYWKDNISKVNFGNRGPNQQILPKLIFNQLLRTKSKEDNRCKLRKKKKNFKILHPTDTIKMIMPGKM